MKTRTCLFIFCLLITVSVGCIAQKSIRGNGHIITKKIEISDYESINMIGCSAYIEYKQSDETPKLTVIIDENVLPYISIKVEGGTLKVAPKALDDPDNEWRNTCNINPSKFKIITNSKNLKEIQAVGSGDFSVLSDLSINKLAVNLAGSGSVNFTKAVKGSKIALSLAGSGDINANDIRVDNLECSLAGSGDITLGGETPRANYNVASSGEINAYKCIVKKLDCSVAGSGEIKAYATENIDATVTGSGSIYHKGNAKASTSVFGSGSIKKVN